MTTNVQPGCNRASTGKLEYLANVSPLAMELQASLFKGAFSWIDSSKAIEPVRHSVQALCKQVQRLTYITQYSEQNQQEETFFLLMAAFESTLASMLEEKKITDLIGAFHMAEGPPLPLRRSLSGASLSLEEIRVQSLQEEFLARGGRLWVFYPEETFTSTEANESYFHALCQRFGDRLHNCPLSSSQLQSSMARQLVQGDAGATYFFRGRKKNKDFSEWCVLLLRRLPQYSQSEQWKIASGSIYHPALLNHSALFVEELKQANGPKELLQLIPIPSL